MRMATLGHVSLQVSRRIANLMQAAKVRISIKATWKASKSLILLLRNCLDLTHSSGTLHGDFPTAQSFSLSSFLGRESLPAYLATSLHHILAVACLCCNLRVNDCLLSRSPHRSVFGVTTRKSLHKRIIGVTSPTISSYEDR